MEHNEATDQNTTTADPVEQVIQFLQTSSSADLRLGADEVPSDLEGSDFSPGALRWRLDEQSHAWWDPERRAANLADADFSDGNLGRADFSRANLSRSVFDGAKAQEINLRSACLESASMRCTDLRFANVHRADLRNADLDGADLWRAAMEKTDLTGASLRGTKFGGASLEEANLSSAQAAEANFDEAMLARACLSGIVAPRASFRGADLDGARLDLSVIAGADFTGARLRGADLTGASVGGASFRGASLKDAILRDLQLAECDLTGVTLSGAKLEGTDISQRQIGSRVGEEIHGDFDGARRAYRTLRRSFEELGDDRAASWAYRRMQRMQRRLHVQNARSAQRRGDTRLCLAEAARALRDLIVEWTCDYGDSISRVLVSLLGLFIVFGLFYGLTGSVVVVPTSGGPATIVRDPLHVAAFALTALLTGGGAGDLHARNTVVQLIVGLQAFFGIALTGLMAFVVGMKIRRS